MIAQLIVDSYMRNIVFLSLSLYFQLGLFGLAAVAALLAYGNLA